MKFFVRINLALFFFFLAWPVGAYYSLGKPNGFVNDFAGVLSAGQKQALESKISQFEKSSSNEIAVVSIKNLQGDTIENFAVKLFEEWGIGKKKNDNGVLILIALEDRQMRIEVGYGLEGALTDAQASQIINNVMKPAFRANDYAGGLNGAVDSIIAATKGEYIPIKSGSSDKTEDYDWVAIIGFVGFMFIWLASILGRSKSWWLGGIIGGFFGFVIGIILESFFLVGILMAVLIPLGLLFDFIVSKKYKEGKARGHIPWWVGGSSGGFGGGGFGGFGGGGSGGGGSSGGW